jgi:hypothetical protein
MARALYVGGFGNGEKTAEKVLDALADYYEEVDGFTFADAMQKTETIKRWATGADIVTHSAGRMAVIGAKPNYIHAFNASVPIPRARLLAKTVKKTAVMLASVRGKDDVNAVAAYSKDTLVEFSKHPIGNFMPFIRGEISEFDGGYEARLGVAAGIPESHVSTDQDAYFDHDPFSLELLRRNGVHVVRLAGQHDELPLRPIETLDAYFRHHAK